MEKFLKITLASRPFLIPVKSILHIETGSDTEIKVLYNSVGYIGSATSQVIGLKLTSTDASSQGRTKLQLTALANLIEEALTMPWTKPVLDITTRLPYALTSITQIEEEWSA